VTAERFDLVVIGAGPAGEKAGAQAAYFGKRVAIIDRSATPGGTSVGSGDVPTKTLREAALYLSGFRQREIYGLSMSLDATTMLRSLRERGREVSGTMTNSVLRNIERHGIELVHGNGCLDPDGTVRVALADGGERSLAGRFVLIATGSRPYRPPSIPFDDPDVSDSETILDLDRLPETLVVIGGGPIATEYASVFTALGTSVTLVDGADRLLPFLDRELSDLMAAVFRRAGMRVELGRSPVEVARIDGVLRVRIAGEHELTPEKVLFASGRAGNTSGMGLEEAGVRLDPRGRVLVDARYRTDARGILAAGDVIGPPALASVSMEQGRVAVCEAFGIDFKHVVDPTPPMAVFTVPEVAKVGMSEEEAAADGVAYEVGRAHLANNTRAVIAGHTEGLVKLVFRADDKRLLGVHVLADAASELVHIGQMVLEEGGTIDRFINSSFAVPTYADAYKYAAYDGLQAIQRRT
jgi:NAD(P) transhydrogenase